METTVPNEARSLVVPIVPRDGQLELAVGMRKILAAEVRGEEIAAVTPQKAPELLATFNRGYLDASNAFAKLKYEAARAEDEVNKVRASIMIDKIPSILKEKGLHSSADMREAIVNADPEYQEAKDRLAFLEAAVEFMKGKMKFLENAYTSVKKIMDTGNWQMVLKGGKSELSGEIPEGASAGGRFGAPR